MSDLREAFERVADRAARAARTQPASNVIRREIMALADRALSQPEAVEAVADQLLTPRRFLDDILSACDASNWDADRNKGAYFRGLNDAYEAIHEIAIEYQMSIYAWCKRADTAPPSQSAEMRRAYHSGVEAMCRSAVNIAKPWPTAGFPKSEIDKAIDECRNKIVAAIKRSSEALSRADEGKESEGGKPIDVLATIDPDYAESFDRTVKCSDPTPAEQREEIARLVEEQAQQIHAREHCHPPQEDNEADKWAMYRIRQELNTFVWHVLALSTRAGG